MKLKKLGAVAVACLGFTFAAQANEVVVSSDQPATITYKVAHQNKNSQPTFSNEQSLTLNKKTLIPVSLDDYDLVGIVVTSVNNHLISVSENQFNQPKQCSVTTSKTHASGVLQLFLSDTHTVKCHTAGGIFG